MVKKLEKKLEGSMAVQIAEVRFKLENEYK